MTCLPTGIGIDLGTTKSCLAVSRREPDGRETTTLVDLTGSSGCRGPALPSAVAITGPDEARVFGDDALRLRGRPGFRDDHEMFFEAKNLMGLRYTYASAPEGLSTPTDVASAVLGQLWTLASQRVALPDDAPVVITVPASFQGAQRRATLEAARKALGDKRSLRLLDEPCAAFLDFVQRDPEALERLPPRSRLMVFDFGGGTCDVAIFEMARAAGNPLGARLLGSSRYHRLGGGDIDRAIVHDHLLPRLLEENGLKRWDVHWGEKRRVLEPQLLAVAENLKLALSAQMARSTGTPAAGHGVAAYGPVDVVFRDRHLTLRTPSLTEAELHKLLVRFLDLDPPPEAGDEYVQRSSIFAPIVQALTRTSLQAEDIDAVLLCGTSSLLPPVRTALAKRFPMAKHWQTTDFDALQGTVARGGARQALALAEGGTPLIANVCSSDLHLSIADGVVTLAHAGDAVPVQSPTMVALRPPADSLQPVSLAVELSADGGRTIGRSLWMLTPPVRRDERLELRWRIDEDQCAELQLNRPGDAGTAPFRQRFEAPIVHRDAGQRVRIRMLEREEALRRNDIPSWGRGAAFEDHARDCASLGEYEKALFSLSVAMQEKGATPNLLNLRGLYREKIGDAEGAMASYREAGDFGPALFNLSLLHMGRGEHDSALEVVTKSLAIDEDRPSQALRGNILQRMGRADEARVAWQDAVSGKLDLKNGNDWELSWLKFAAKSLQDTRLTQRIDKALLALEARADIPARQGVLPERAIG